MLHAARFLLCSVVAAFARLVRQLRCKALMASSSSSSLSLCSPAVSATAAALAASPAGLVSAAPLAPPRKVAAPVAVQKLAPLVAVAPPPPVLLVVSGGDVEHQQVESRKKKTKEAWAARMRRPAMLVIPVADDAREVAAGWGAPPVKEADVVVVDGEGFYVASRAGPRHAMEDAYAVTTDKNGGDSQLAFYGVFDGHGGRAAVDFVSEHLGKNVVAAVLAAGATTTRDDEASSASEEDAVSAAIRAAYLATDSELLLQHQGAMSGGGACATTALVKNGDLYVAHLGDCRAVLSRGGGVAAALTADHTCASADERARIERGGGYVSRSGSGVWRVQGSLAVSRSFGDGALKRWVVAEPAVARVPLDAGCEFLVMASDGLWDKVSNQEAVDVVSRSRDTACGELVDLARRRGSRDDVTVMVVDLERFVR